MDPVQILTDVVTARQRQLARVQDLCTKGDAGAGDVDEAFIALRLAELELWRERERLPYRTALPGGPLK